MNQNLRQTLLDMVDETRRKRAELAADGSLFLGYNAELRALHNAQAKTLAGIVDQQGWPNVDKVGADGAAAAWMVVQQAIGLPNFMRACLEILESEAAAGRVPRWQPALLTDRIRWLEGREQVYGTQFDWDENGELNPLPIEDAANVDARRAAAELVPLADGIRQRRSEAEQAGETAPANWEARRKEFEDWAKAIGWRK